MCRDQSSILWRCWKRGWHSIKENRSCLERKSLLRRWIRKCSKNVSLTKEWSRSSFLNQKVLKTYDFEGVIVLPCSAPELASPFTINSEYWEWFVAGAGMGSYWVVVVFDWADPVFESLIFVEVTREVEEKDELDTAESVANVIALSRW